MIKEINKMTNFERTYLINRPSNIVITYSDGTKKQNEVVDAYQKQKQDFYMQLQYRELDRLSAELEKEIQAMKALRMEMEKYKVDFNLKVEDEATKKIQEVVNRIDTMFK